MAGPLDNRSFADLLREAEAIVQARSPGWTDLSPGDPGTTLIEVYAHLTEVMLYRLNRLPERLHAGLLKLLGFTPLTPAAAVVTVRFSRLGDSTGAVELPSGTRISDPGGSVVFTTLESARLAEGGAEVEVLALHAEPVDGELLGLGSGGPGQNFRLKRAPVVRATDPGADLRIGVETDAVAVPHEAEVISLDGRAFVLWEEVPSFSAAGNSRCFVADRVDGRITFAPQGGLRFGSGGTMAAVPPSGAQIRAWYRSGGGRAGNVGPGTLTLLRTPVAGISVTNPARAVGGEDGESPEAMLMRGRDAVRTLECAVTARDFERVATTAGGIARARAYAQREFWAFGEPGVVEVLAVPSLAEEGLPVTAERLLAHQTAELLARVAAALDARRPLGVRCAVRWAHCRPVSVSARIVVSPSEDVSRLKARLLARLDALLSPVGGWSFGKALRASDVYETLLAEPGVRFAEGLVLSIDDGPAGGVRGLANDPHQPRTLYAAAGNGVHRSLDDGESWANVLRLPDTRFGLIACSDEVPGLIAAAGEAAGGAWTLSVSRDGGESWEAIETVQHVLFDLAFVRRDGRALLMLASRNGLFQVDPEGPRGLTPISVGSAGTEGFFSVASGVSPAGTQFVAVARRGKAGVMISSEGGASGSFIPLPGAEKDIRELRFERDGGQLYLWAAVWAEGGEAGEGVLRTTARADGADPGGWSAYSAGWAGGSCRSFALSDSSLIAGTRDAGVLVLDKNAAEPRWRAPLLNCGLPIDTERARLLTISAVATTRSGATPFILAGGEDGLFRGSAELLLFAASGGTSFTERVPLPPNWLFCSGTHDLSVVADSDRLGG